MTVVVNFLSSSAASNVVGHVAFFLVNLLNASYLIVFEWFIFRRLQKNILSRLVLLAVCLQMVSCASTIYKFNIDDPKHPIHAHLGVAFAQAALTVLNICVSILAFNVKKKLIIALSISCGIFAVIMFAVNYVMLDQIGFIPFTIFIGLSILYQTCCIFVGRRAFLQKRIALDTAILSSELMSRLLSVSLFGHIFLLLISFVPIKVVLYTASGLVFVNCNVLMVYVGQMDFMVKSDEASAENEETSDRRGQSEPRTP